jgi:hypothetical protein
MEQAPARKKASNFNVQEEYYSESSGGEQEGATAAPAEEAPQPTQPITFTTEQSSEIKKLAGTGDMAALGQYVAGIVGTVQTEEEVVE